MRRSGKAPYQAGRLLAMLGAAGVAIVTGGCGGSTAPAAPTLAANSATVQFALNRFTTGTVSVPASCGTIGINCPGGTAGSATQLSVARSGLTIVQAAADSFDYAVDLAIATQTPFMVSSSGVDCGVAVNTAAGTSPAVHLAGTAKFSSRTLGGPIDQIDLTTQLTGAEAADLTVTGSQACQVLGTNLVFAEGVIVNALSEHSTHLCAASGGQLTTCS